MALRTRTILFIEDDFISEKQQIVRKYYQFTKTPQPVIEPQFPWEGNRVYIFGSVDYQGEGPIRMWYQAIDTLPMNAPDHMTICYAESRDGRVFRKPELEVCRYHSRHKTNIVLGNTVYPGNPYCASVIRDGDKFLMTVWYEGWSDTISSYSGAKTFSSHDGLHFSPTLPDEPYVLEIKGGPNDVNCLSPDKLDGNYVSYQVMQRYISPDKQRYDRDLIAGRERILYMQESRDFITWSEPSMVLEPSHDDPDFFQFYGMSGFRYGQYWLGIIWTYFVHDQTMGTELAVSTDGRSWRRAAPGHRMIPLGPVGSFDSGMLQTATSPIIFGGDVLLYYGGSDHYHDQQGSSSIGAASLPIDRWVSVMSSGRGSITTKPLQIDGNSLKVNCYARSGQIRAELLDERLNPMQGYSTADCDVIEDDAVDRIVTWNGRGSLKSFLGRELSIRFEILHAELFSCTVE